MARIAEEFKARCAMLNEAKRTELPRGSQVGSNAKFLFGGDFELDLRAYELRFSSKPLKLSGIPMAMLRLLIEQQGRLVHRHEIVQKIWGEEALINTDQNINETVRRIRRVLNEDPEQPRFLQTVHGKGYRFIAPVVRVGHVSAD
jgi:DNA-binding response OmpR family regulator